MTKLYRQHIKVQTRDGLPVAFRWRGRWYQVTRCIVQERLTSRMWRRPSRPPLYRCETLQGMSCVLIQ